MKLTDGLSVQNGHLFIADSDVCTLAKKYGTPLYVMNYDLIRARCRELREAMDKYCPGGRVMFASKAFMNEAMCRIAYNEGLGLDVVSGGELYTALHAGIPGDCLELHGNNKTEHEIELALKNNIYRIIIDGFDEIALIKSIAKRMGKKNIPVSIRLRPGIEAHTHEAIQTANLDCKFGFSVSGGEAMKAAEMLLGDDTFRLCGVHCHIGSQIFQTSPFSILCAHFVDFAQRLRQKTGYTAKEFNFGGGFGVWYVNGDTPVELGSYIKTIADTLKELCAQASFPMPHITVEPGRSIVGEAGTTLYTVGGVKNIPGIRTYVSVDGGMFDNPRCALYDSHYTVVCADRADAPHDNTVTLAGKCCESGDIITKDALLPQDIRPGETVAVLTTGAYNYSMASNYNRNGVPAVVLVGKGTESIIVKRQTYEDLVSHDVLPDFLK